MVLLDGFVRGNHVYFKPWHLHICIIGIATNVCKVIFNLAANLDKYSIILRFRSMLKEKKEMNYYRQIYVLKSLARHIPDEK